MTGRKWEYLECRNGDAWYDLDLNESNYSYKSIAEAGLDGWELIQRYYFESNYENGDAEVLLFKREIVETSKSPEPIN